MVRRHRSGRSLRELREEAAAAEALGLNEPKPRTSEARPRPPFASGSASETGRSAPKTSPRQRLVWAVCDSGGRTVATFPYPEKAQAEAHALQLKSRGKGAHFVRSVKEAMTSDS